jgi:hypothetical protein
LIQIFSRVYDYDITKMRYLIIRIGKRDLIIFDYGVFNDDYYLRMIVFDINLIIIIDLVDLLIEKSKELR